MRCFVSVLLAAASQTIRSGGAGSCSARTTLREAMADDDLFPETRTSKVGVICADRTSFPSTRPENQRVVRQHFVDHPVLVDPVSVRFASRCRRDASGT